MSRKRSRNITGKWPINSQVLKYAPDIEKYFGSEVLPEFDTLDEFQGNLTRKTQYDESSSSSLSGYEDFEAEATRKVENELIKMNKILQKQIPIPKKYDKDEYQQWMKFFPKISIWETNSTDKFELSSSNNEIHVRHVSGEVHKSQKLSRDKKCRKDRIMTDNCNKNIEVHENGENKSLLSEESGRRISNSSFNKIRYGNDLEKVRALSRSEVLSSRWMKNSDGCDYSLPQIFSASVLSTRIPQKKSTIVDKKGTSRHNIVLPPIKSNVNHNDINSSINGIRATKKRYPISLYSNIHSTKSSRWKDPRKRNEEWL